MAVDDTVAALKQAVASATAARQRLAQAQQALQEAGLDLAQATAGTGAPEVGQAMGGFAQAAQDTVALDGLVTKGSGAAEAYARSLAGDGQDQPGPAPPSSGKVAQDDPVEKARQELPTRGTGRGVKTQGRWFAPGKTTSTVTSGRDGWTDRVNEVVKEAGCPFVPLTAAADVELKVAAEMRDTGIMDATVVINNEPCTGLTSCDNLLGVVLPEGSTLTVHGTRGFKKIYKGGKRW